MKNKKNLIWIFLFACLYVKGQQPLINIPTYADAPLVSKLMDSIGRGLMDTSLVFLKQINDTGDYVTYFIWLTKGSMNVIKINDTCRTGIEKGINFFGSKMDVNHISILESENDLKFKAPTLSPSGCDIVFINIKKKQYLVILGKGNGSSYFNLSKARELPRTLFMKSLNESLSPISKSWNCVQKQRR